jgi:hypothetical protein
MRGGVIRRSKGKGKGGLGKKDQKKCEKRMKRGKKNEKLNHLSFTYSFQTFFLE